MAFQAFITVEGVKQGQFKGESTAAGQSALIPIFNFQSQVSQPTDPTTGAASGKRRHSPITITKQFGAASPQFYQALVTGETLKSASITFTRHSPDGIEVTYFKILLTNAVVVGIHQFIGGAPGLTENANALEEISVTYQKIQITDLDAQTSATDDWVGI